ncbi:MAG: DinB family protein [Aggregatilineales bacterium]
MTTDDIKLLYEYNYWANKRILSMAEQVSPAQLMMPTTFSWDSLHKTLVHLLDTEYGWRVVCDEGKTTFAWQPEEFPTLASIQIRWNEEEKAMWAYLNKLTDENLQEPISYEVDGTIRKRILWHCLVHVVNHGTQHRSECGAMLTDLDKSPGDMDFTIFLSER